MSTDTPSTEISNDRDEAIRRLTARRHLTQTGVAAVYTHRGITEEDVQKEIQRRG